MESQTTIMQMAAVVSAAAVGGFVAFNPETGTTAQGETVEEALANLKEATELYWEEAPKMPSGRALI